MYIIHKATMSPQEDSYSGPTWDAAGLRELYKPQYTVMWVAEFIAKKLSQYSNAGFRVASIHEVKEGTEEIQDWIERTKAEVRGEKA